MGCQGSECPDFLASLAAGGGKAELDDSLAVRHSGKSKNDISLSERKAATFFT